MKLCNHRMNWWFSLIHDLIPLQSKVATSVLQTCFVMTLFFYKPYLLFLDAFLRDTPLVNLVMGTYLKCIRPCCGTQAKRDALQQVAPVLADQPDSFVRSWAKPLEDTSPHIRRLGCLNKFVSGVFSIFHAYALFCAVCDFSRSDTSVLFLKLAVARKLSM